MSLHPVTPSLVCQYGASTSVARLGDNTIDLRLSVPHLAGSRLETFHVPGGEARRQQDFLVVEADQLLFGVAVTAAPGPLDLPAARLYQQLLDVSRGWHLYRVWNYVPRINQARHGIESYQQFNIGRWQAFEGVYGRHLRSFLPAASAVGIHGDDMVVAFVAGRQPGRFLENPDQVPAYHYPEDYGPRSPGFSRASMAGCGGIDLAFISGTASIRGHASVRIGDVSGQLDVTLDNLEIMGRQMGIDLRQHDRDDRASWHLKCYLRNPGDLAAVQAQLEQRIGRAAADFIFLQADICRRELDIEIEAARLIVG